MEAPSIVSVDDHVLETPDIWQDRLPARYREIGPRVARERGTSFFGRRPDDAANSYAYEPGEGRWCDVWHYEDVAIPLMRGVAAAGYMDDIHSSGQFAITFDEVRPGCYDVDARLADMDMNGVAASLNFPNEFVRFAGQRFLMAHDKELALLCVRAYNDWVVDAWCAPSNGRLIPLCIVPLWDPLLAADEVRRTAARGVPAVAFTELPANLGLPSIFSGHWDPFFGACNETRTVLSIHIGSSSKLPSTSDDAFHVVTGSLVHVNCMMSLTDWIMSGVLRRYPDLRLLFAECQIGWIPYQLQRMDYAWREYAAWSWGEQHGHEVLPEPPSTYFRERVLCSFFEDEHGVRSIVSAGITDNVALEVDYPHGDSTWPRSAEVVTSIREMLEPAVAAKVIHGNAERFLGLSGR
jgi:predicted TIM-barrel fold metal-dependent hydrolase